MPRQSWDILTGGKKGKCHLDGISLHVSSVRFMPSGMTGYRRFSRNRPCRSTGESGRNETVAVGSHAVQEVSGQVPLAEVRGGQQWPVS